MTADAWTCPFCDRDTTITDSDSDSGTVTLYRKSADGHHCLSYRRIVCPNAKCRKFTLTVSLFEVEWIAGSWTTGKHLKTWRLVPPSKAKVFPDYVPKAIRADYTEACLIVDLSPKASATLARRCLQGMIRNFWGVSKPTLQKEIDAIQDKVDPLTWKAIDSVRHMGNIGAHMEKEINVIVDVDSDEAAKLIWLIELLVHEWYITRHEREERLKEIGALKETKQAEKNETSQNSKT
jgi:Domain of unknown function (DUF4145)